jgi:hypothetical protein
MKGILKNTKAGWFVLYQVMRDEITSGYDSIPLHADSQTWMLYEGKEVQFEIVMDKPDHTYSQTPYAKTIDEDALSCSYPNCICQGDEITYCNNRTPEQVVLGDKTALVEDVFHQGLTADEIIDNHLNLVGPTNFDVYSNRDAVKEAMIMFATQKTALVEDVFHQGMKKTAIQQLIDEIVEHFTYDNYLTDDNKITLETIRLRCLGKLLVEKEQLISAHNQGYADGYRDNGNSPIDYYNQIYGK